jgi:glutathione S-transferase
MHRLTYRVYGTASSGNCHKVRLALDLLHLQYRWHEVDILQGETRTPDYLAMNPNGKVPLLQIDSDVYLPESNAILCYLADGTHLWQGDRVQRAQVLQWMFFEQYSHEPYIAVARFVCGYLGKHDDPRLPELIKRGNAALDVMEWHLTGRDWFAGDGLSIADLALYAYTCRADEGGFDLARVPQVSAWLARVEATAGVTRTPPAPGAGA